MSITRPWTWMLPRQQFLHSLRKSSYTIPISSEFLTSPSFNCVNPRHHVTATDKVTQTIPAASIAGLSDETILSLFTTGFFSGFVFGFERLVLRSGGFRLLPARYTGFQSDPEAVTIWDRSQVPDNHLLPVGSCLFGSFRVLDKHIAGEADHNSSRSDSSSSYVDYGFGSDKFIFAGCHRFQITRLPPSMDSGGEAGSGSESGSTGQQVLIQLQHFRCNPQRNVPSVAEYIERFHFVYAKALFANGVQALLGR
ncbi:hypothetical protein BJX99DRAFT_255963 [Aspergillus californicus]